ncbi:hypothetical protein CLV27_0309 [Phorcysia thermohydrogeniphila]|uniref:Uncharacterized protein n=2 Tax=Phorcysia thermohydrogeniphila TaxID=936138 RepID=A0A4R1GET3_9BACT|nr:hypothetical protein CLV27_0309 [Phorcysia thermohydrogeniphila]
MWRLFLCLFIGLVLFFPFKHVLSCSSDCYKCHSSIPADKNHEVLKSCTSCHPDHDEKALSSKCGADCFDCHSVARVMSSSPAHKVIGQCIDCHKKLSPKESPAVEELYNQLIGG